MFRAAQKEFSSPPNVRIPVPVVWQPYYPPETTRIDETQLRYGRKFMMLARFIFTAETDSRFWPGVPCRCGILSNRETEDQFPTVWKRL